MYIRVANSIIRSIDRSITPTIDQPDLTFDYGPDGQRIRKAVTWSTGGDTTWYVRDAQGNTMAVYQERNDSIFVKEHYMYGSSRLGSIHDWTYVNSLTPHTDTNRITRVLGKKNYELTNHLGNILTTISDQKKAIQDGTTGTIAHWTADIVSYSDYYPFGMMMTGRNGGGMDAYRYGFNGMENDDEIKGEGNNLDFGARIYDSRLGRWLSVDPLQRKYPDLTAYAGMGLNPIIYADLDGRDIVIMIDGQEVYRWDDGRGSGPGQVTTYDVPMRAWIAGTTEVPDPTGLLHRINQFELDFIMDRPVSFVRNVWQANSIRDQLKITMPTHIQLQDAITHFVFSALSVEDWGEDDARLWGVVHEVSGFMNGSNTPEERRMDLKNNQKAFQYHDLVFTNGELDKTKLFYLFKNLVESGQIDIRGEELPTQAEWDTFRQKLLGESNNASSSTSTQGNGSNGNENSETESSNDNTDEDDQG